MKGGHQPERNWKQDVAMGCTPASQPLVRADLQEVTLSLGCVSPGICGWSPQGPLGMSCVT